MQYIVLRVDYHTIVQHFDNHLGVFFSRNRSTAASEEDTKTGVETLRESSYDVLTNPKNYQSSTTATEA